MTSIIPRIVEEFKRQYESKYSLLIPNDWLSQCAEFISEEFPNKPVNEYIDLIFSQLLDYDLNVIGTESIKSSFFKSPNGTLNGSFFLQLKYCIDITDSNFSVVQKLRGIVSENALVDADNVPTTTQFERSNIKKNRMLTLYLTDGKNSLTAIENRLIPNINSDLLPGTKIEISGRIPYENNILLLEPQNIKVLGGNVEDIGTIDYMLQLIEQDIYKKCSEATTSEREKIKNFDTSSNTSRRADLKPSNTDYKSQGNYKIEKSTQNYSSFNTKQNNFKNLNNIEDSEDDILLMNSDLTTLESKSQNIKPCYESNNENYSIKRPPSNDGISNIIKTSNQNNNIKKQKVKDIIEIDEDDDFKYLKNKNMNSIKPNLKNNNDDDDFYLAKIDEKNLKTNKQNLNQQQGFNKENIENNKQNDSSDEFEAFLNNSVKIDTEGKSEYIKVSTLNDATFLNHCCLKNKPSNDPLNTLSTCNHLIKGQFKQVVSMLKQFKLKWYQEIIVTDDSDEMCCYIGNEPLTDLLELTCKEAKDLFIKSKETGDQKYHQIFEQKRINCQQKLRTLKATFSLKYDFEKNKFCIYRIENI